jgi:hypothetical protein
MKSEGQVKKHAVNLLVDSDLLDQHDAMMAALDFIFTGV